MQVCRHKSDWWFVGRSVRRSVALGPNFYKFNFLQHSARRSLNISKFVSRCTALLVKHGVRTLAETGVICVSMAFMMYLAALIIRHVYLLHISR